ncbi:MAG TPA: hypothetical protein VF283_02160 [Bryobacteraceae bacterium]
MIIHQNASEMLDRLYELAERENRESPLIRQARPPLSGGLPKQITHFDSEEIATFDGPATASSCWSRAETQLAMCF